MIVYLCFIILKWVQSVKELDYIIKFIKRKLSKIE